MAGFKYRNYRPDIADDLKRLLNYCLDQNQTKHGTINEAAAVSAMVELLEHHYPEHRMAVMNRDLLYEVCKGAVSTHINQYCDSVYLRADLNGAIPKDVREALEATSRVRRYFRVKDKHTGQYRVKRREKLDPDDWEQIRKQRAQHRREVWRWEDYADCMCRLAEALAIEGAVGEQVFALPASAE